MTDICPAYGKKLIFILLVILIAEYLSAGSLYAQAGTISVSDSKTGERIPFVHVFIVDLSTKAEYFNVTDNDGLTGNPGRGRSLIRISSIGYLTLNDTIEAGRSYDFQLVPSVFSLDEVVVTGSVTPKKADQSIYDIKVLDSRKIEEKAAFNLKDILSGRINMTISQDPALGSSLRIKGLSGNNVKILMDGVPVIGRMGGNIDLSQLGLYNIDHIELVEGPMSVVYGSNALGGVINLITKENKNSNFSFASTAYYETVGTYNIDANLALRKKRHSISLAGSRNFFGGFSTDTLRYQLWKPKEQYNGDLYYMYSHDNAKIKVRSSYMYERLWDKGNLLEPRYYTAFDSWFYSNRFTNRLDYDRTLSDERSLKMLISHSWYSREKRTYIKDLSDLTQALSPNESDLDTTKFNALMYRFEYARHNAEKKLNYTLGFDLNHEIGTGKRIEGGRKQMGDYALFLSLQYSPFERLSFQPGFRVALNTAYNVPPVPSVNIKWEIVKRLNLRASYARGYRAPTLKELYLYFVDVNHNIQPNNELKAEYGHNFDLSIGYDTEKEKKVHYSGIDLSMFYNNMHDIIQLALRTEGAGAGVYQYINVSSYNTLGYQASLSYNFYPYLEVTYGLGQTGSYYSLDNKPASFSDYRFSADMNMNIGWNIPALKLRLSMFYKYTGTTWLFSIDGSDNIEFGRLDPYQDLDFTVVRKFFSNKLTVSTGIKNILNNTNINRYGVASTGVHSGGTGESPVGYGRVYFLKLSYAISK